VKNSKRASEPMGTRQRETDQDGLLEGAGKDSISSTKVGKGGMGGKRDESGKKDEGNRAGNFSCQVQRPKWRTGAPEGTTKRLKLVEVGGQMQNERCGRKSRSGGGRPLGGKSDRDQYSQPREGHNADKKDGCLCLAWSGREIKGGRRRDGVRSRIVWRRVYNWAKQEETCQTPRADHAGGRRGTLLR